MQLKIQRELLLEPLQKVIGAVERRHTLPILGNILIQAGEDRVTLTATDLEVELVASVGFHVETPGQITIPARKLLDISRNLPADADVEIRKEGERTILRSGKSRFSLTSLPAEDFPSIGELEQADQFTLPQNQLKELIEKTAFSMAQQDVRYYLNGLLLELGPQTIRTVATDGHRLATCEFPLETPTENRRQVIVPRKGINELQRLLGDTEEEVTLELDDNHIRIGVNDLRFTSKLIDGRFPDYERVIPQQTTQHMEVDRNALRQALVRASILSNEKYKGVRWTMEGDILAIQAHNPDQEEAEEQLAVNYDGQALELGFNVGYMLDVIGVLGDETFRAGFNDANSSCLIETENDAARCRYVIMPMRL